MSYLRVNSILKYVDGKSKDYIFPTSIKRGKKRTRFIEDYGSISNEGIIELLFRHYWDKDDLLMILLLKRLSQNLKINLRKIPLTDRQASNLLINNLYK